MYYAHHAQNLRCFTANRLNLEKQFLVGPTAAMSGAIQCMVDTPNTRTLHRLGLRNPRPHLQHHHIVVFNGLRHCPSQTHPVLLLRSVLPPTYLLVRVSRIAKSCTLNIPFLFLADQSHGCHFSPTRRLPPHNLLRCLLLPHPRLVVVVVKFLYSNEARRVVYSFLTLYSLETTRAWVCCRSVLRNL